MRDRANSMGTENTGLHQGYVVWGTAGQSKQYEALQNRAQWYRALRD